MRKPLAMAAGVNVPITSVSTTSQVSATEADVASARAGISARQAAIRCGQGPARIRLKPTTSKRRAISLRYKQLVDKQEISQQQYDQAVAAAKAGAAAVDAARARPMLPSSQVTQAQDKLLQAEANSAQRPTAPKQMQVMRSRAAVRTGRKHSKRKRTSIRHN